MNENAVPAQIWPEEVYYLSEILGRRVINRGKKIGKLSDIQIVEGGKIPEVANFFIRRPFGDPALLIPWQKIGAINEKEIIVDLADLRDYEHELAPEAIMLKDHVLDKKVLDIEDREVSVVYDVRMVMRNNKLYVTDVDFSRYGLLRRIGLKSLADLIYDRAFMTDAKVQLLGKSNSWDMFINNLANTIKDKTISWAYIQPLPTNLGSFRGEVKLNILKETLADIPPVDLADILEELDHEQRVVIFNKLDNDQASDILEEIDPSIQRDLVSSLEKEKVAKLIDEMTPGQAADILSILPSAQAASILKLLDPENARKMEAIFHKQEENILNFATDSILEFPPDKTVNQAEEDYYRLAKTKDVIMYVYITNEQDKLLGVIDLKELLQASHEMQLKDIMVDKIVSLTPQSTLKEASALFARYGFRAIPVMDENEKLLGVVPYRDVMNLKHRFLE